MAVREFQQLHKAIANLFEALSEAEPAVAVGFAKKAAAQISEIVAEIRSGKESYKDLAPIDKAREEIEAADWRKSKRGGEYVNAEALPTLKKLLEDHAGKYVLDRHAYYLSTNSRWITRYERKGKKRGEGNGQNRI